VRIKTFLERDRGTGETACDLTVDATHLQTPCSAFPVLHDVSVLSRARPATPSVDRGIISKE